MTKDKKYIENLFRNYKRNVARKKILELGLIDDDDYTLGAIDYSKDNVQTSTIANLDNAIIKREEELKQLTKDIALADILLGSLDSRRDSQYRNVVEGYYIEHKTYLEVMNIVGLYKPRYFFDLCNKIMGTLLELI